jgi:hypothetical protein
VVLLHKRVNDLQEGRVVNEAVLVQIHLDSVEILKESHEHAELIKRNALVVFEVLTDLVNLLLISVDHVAVEGVRIDLKVTLD